MPSYYIYLISTLPMLHFGMKPPFSFARFLQICQDFIPESDFAILKTASISGDYTYEKQESIALERWQVFDTALRNELVKIRASRRRLDPLKYLRLEGYTELSLAQLAINAYRTPSILEAEKLLDQTRWNALDELAIGHYFDLDFLLVYAHKLLILERWEKVRNADKSRALEEVLTKS